MRTRLIEEAKRTNISLCPNLPPTTFMHYVYVLKSEKDDSLYIGYANNVIKRVDEHNKGLCISTKGKRPLHLLYYEAYSSEQDARTREMRLKRFKNSYKELVKRIQNSLGHKSGGGFNSINDLRSLQSRKS